MKAIRYTIALAAMILCTQAHADIVIMKKSKAEAQTEESQSLHRYEQEIARMNAQTSDLSDRIMNPEKYKSNDKKDELHVTLIRVR